MRWPLLVLAAAACEEPLPEATSIALNRTALQFISSRETALLIASVYDQNGGLMAGHVVSWSSSDNAVVSVDQTGLLRPQGTGGASVSATAGSASASASVTVVFDAEREALIAFYEATRGGTWRENSRWLSDAPLRDWYGVETGADGRVVGLNLRFNGLSGTIPPEIGDLTQLRELLLYGNGLSGRIPPEIGNLTQLTDFVLFSNGLSGTIPPEIGNLAQLDHLVLRDNHLSGRIPPEIGNLTELLWLSLDNNQVSGSIPPQLGNLTKLYGLELHNNQLSGPIPGELGGLARLERLYLHDNRLSGEIPGDLSNLTRLTELWIGGNDFGGPFPVVLTRLEGLDILMLAGNPHTGTLPDEIGNMTSLTSLILTDSGLSGLLPMGITRLGGLSELMLAGTGLCAPVDDEFQAWLKGVPKRRIPSCEEPEEGSVAYLTQAVQSMEYPVPLVAGEDALLRVFVVAPAAAGDTIPMVRATFFVDGEETEVVEIERVSSIIGEQVNEGSLHASANVLVPASLIQPGLEMVVEIDPEGTAAPELGVKQRIPETGRMPMDVRAMPDLEFTLIPFLWSENPDSAILDITGNLSPGDPLLRDIRDLLPVAEIDLNIHEPVVTNSNNAFSMLEQTGAIRAAEGGTGYFMGTMSGPVTGAGGLAWVPGWTSFSIPDSSVMAHELGHNLSLRHAPGCGAGRPDISFPQSDGTIGTWGFDFLTGELVEPSVHDLMSYCDPSWISEFFFTNSLRHRLAWEAAERSRRPAAASTLSLLITGGVDSAGVPYLRPAFVIDAPPSLPGVRRAHIA